MLPFFFVGATSCPSHMTMERAPGGTQVRDDGSLGLLGADGSDV